ncbi:carbohydrate kinase [Flavobacterium sp.]|uniref:carbohydrate kinase family protein n=1 Tax=Flavobacterium sp. TaxID=239 RepID=UPI002626D370|nr:carbohydrate kinase [Flavobacterium sp.]MDG2431232.1 carbohydrate kinase [Flavobacterium sp.]
MNKSIAEFNIVSFGEVLYDLFPNHQKIGGAPLNVALRLASLGLSAHIISRVGNDALGKKLIAYVNNHGVNSSAIQIDDVLPTGEVIVALNASGSATYSISYPVAWDKIATVLANDTLVKNADAFVFGSLVSRDDVSRQSLLQLIKCAKYTVFDVNLRAPFYNQKVLLQLMEKSDFIKFNDSELAEIGTFMHSPYQTVEENIHFIAKKTNTKHICVTKGDQGAVLYYNEQIYYSKGFQVTIKDTVGAGDSFLAGLLSKLLLGNNPQEAVDFACALGAAVAMKEGANATISPEEISILLTTKSNE